MSFNGEWVWLIVSFVLSLLVFSYLFGDNPVFRLVSALFVGVTAGYFAVVLVYQVVITRLAVPMLQGILITVVPLLLSGMLLSKLSPRLSQVGNLPMALLVGVGAAVAVGGALLGTIFGQIGGSLVFFGKSSTGQPPTVFGFIEGIFFLLGTLSVLAYFNFGARQKKLTEIRRSGLTAVFATLGQVFIAITLGAVFAGVLTAGLTALVERSDFILNTITGLIR